MAKFIGIKVVAPSKDVFGSVQTYETQLQSTSAALLEVDSGISSQNIPHSRNGKLPLALVSLVRGDGKRGALTLAGVNDKEVLVGSNHFYRIFTNAQEPYFISELDEPDMVGDIKLIPYLVPPSGWLECNGQAVLRASYPDLFALIGESFGAGDGTTTFNLPNFKGRVPVHRDSAQTEFDTLGETGGAKTHTLTINEIPSHSHFVMNTDVNGGTGGAAHANRAVVNNPTGDRNYDIGGNNTTPNVFSSSNTGSGQSHSNLQPYQVAGLYIIKVSP